MQDAEIVRKHLEGRADDLRGMGHPLNCLADKLLYSLALIASLFFSFLHLL